jgi:hypothetical protein
MMVKSLPVIPSRTSLNQGCQQPRLGQELEHYKNSHCDDWCWCCVVLWWKVQGERVGQLVYGGWVQLEATSSSLQRSHRLARL